MGREVGNHLRPAGEKLNLCLHDGDEKAEYEGFPGNFFLNAANKARPAVIDRDRSPLIQADGRPYAGCYVNAVIDIWAQDNNFGKRVNASLVASSSCATVTRSLAAVLQRRTTSTTSAKAQTPPLV
jgi:hypothetical protein